MTASFRRMPEFDRRSDMIEATLDCIAEVGIQATTVRAVAAHAGVTNGLIRHHFASKDNLMIAAYRRIIEMMTEPALAVLRSDEGTPHDRLARFVLASLSGPVADPRMLSLWATFVSQIHVDPTYSEEHRTGYLAFRDAIETLIGQALAADGRSESAEQIKHLAIAVNAVIDGLWIEGGLSAAEIDEDLQIAIGIRSVEALLGIELPDVRQNGKAS